MTEFCIDKWDSNYKGINDYRGLELITFKCRKEGCKRSFILKFTEFLKSIDNYICANYVRDLVIDTAKKEGIWLYYCPFCKAYGVNIIRVSQFIDYTVYEQV